MARIARVMLAGCPFHVTHRGNQRRLTFDSDGDRRAYLALLSRYSRQFGMKVWAYCLMLNHIHLIVVGDERLSIARAVGNTHRVHSLLWNRRSDVTGHLWANRFFSTALDDVHLWAAVRYVELNPVRAGLTDSPLDYPWSSARAHAGIATDDVLELGPPFPGPIGDWRTWLSLGLEEETAARIRANTASGKPTGSESFRCGLGERVTDKKRRQGVPKSPVWKTSPSRIGE